MSTDTDGKAFDQFLQAVIEGATTVLEQIAAQECKVERCDPGQANSDIEVQFVSHGALEGAFAFAMPQATAVRWAKLLMGEPAQAAELTDDDREALYELSRQIAGQAGSRLEHAFGKTELKFTGAPDAAGWTQRATLSVGIGSESMTVELCFSDDLLRSLAGHNASPEKATTASPQPPAPTANSIPYEPGVRPDNLQLLLDVPLQVVLRFGKRELLLKDILELSPGSVLELDRQVTDPVDLLLDKKVIARGEVVVVDGNYGLRVTAVASPEEKLACLS